MSRRWWNRTNTWCALLLAASTVVVPPSVLADKKKDLLKQAQAAEADRRFGTAESAYCELARMDSGNKNALAKCEYYRDARQAFEQGLVAYNNNDFLRARTLLLQASVVHQGASEYITKIDQYTDNFNAGFKLARNGQAKEAIERFRRALKIKPDGPWELRNKIAALEREQPAPAPATKTLSAEDPVLVQGIKDFYEGSYVAAEQKLAAYKGEGPRKALALFFLGASELTRYYLAGSTAPDDALSRSALDHFSAAKQVSAEFSPPVSYVSPRILDAYQKTDSKQK